MDQRYAFPVCLLLALAGTFGCSDDDEDPIEETQNGEECREACTGWERCSGEAFDVLECRQRCVEAIDDDRIGRGAVDDCDDCVDDADAAQCVAECADVCAVVTETFDVE